MPQDLKFNVPLSKQHNENKYRTNNINQGRHSANIDKHKSLINLASSLKASVIFFFELSLTGYEPELAKELAANQDDRRLYDFQQISDVNRIAIGLGIPTKTKTGIHVQLSFEI